MFISAIGFNLSLSAAEYARYYFALRSICQLTSESFPLRCLDEELEGRLSQRADSYSAAIEASQPRARRWEWWNDADLRRSV